MMTWRQTGAIVGLAALALSAAGSARAACAIGTAGDGYRLSVLEVTGDQRKAAVVIARRLGILAPKRKWFLRTLGRNGLVVATPAATGASEFLFRPGRLAFHRVDERATSPGADQFRAPGREGGVTYILDRAPVIRGARFVKASVGFDSGGGPAIAFRFDEKSGRRFAAFTAGHIGSVLAIVLDGQVISAPRIMQPIQSGNGLITGNFAMAEATQLAAVMGGGALTGKVKLRAQGVLGPLAVNRAVTAGALWIRYSLKSAPDTSLLCQRLGNLAGGDISVQRGADWRSVEIWVEADGRADAAAIGRAADRALRGVVATRPSPAARAGPAILPGPGGLFGRLKGLFD